MVLDLDVYELEIPVIIGRPFLATSKALIDVLEGMITLRVEDEKVNFDLLKMDDQPSKEALTEPPRERTLELEILRPSCDNLHKHQSNEQGIPHKPYHKRPRS